MDNIYTFTRSLDYQVKQTFVVRAEDGDKASEKLTDFLEGPWDKASSLHLGVVQTRDSMEQVENSQSIVLDEEDVNAQTLSADSSLQKLVLDGKAQAMFSLLKQLANGSISGDSAIGAAKELVSTLENEMHEPQRTLLTILAGR